MTKIEDSCFHLFKNLKILPFKSQYIFSLLLFVAKNRDLYESNSAIHNINTRFSWFTYYNCKLNNFLKKSLLFWIKVFNYLPTNIKNTSHDINQFRSVLKSFILINSYHIYSPSLDLYKYGISLHKCARHLS